jgi:hypothetical protein
MVILQYTNVTLRFFLELCALAALGCWGFQTGKGLVLKIVLGIGTPILIAVVWGMFGSPQATVKLSVLLHLLLEVIVFGLPVVALFAAGKPNLALVFGLTVVINRALMYVWGQ